MTEVERINDPLGRRPDRRRRSSGETAARFPDRDAVVFPGWGCAGRGASWTGGWTLWRRA